MTTAPDPRTTVMHDVARLSDEAADLAARMTRFTAGMADLRSRVESAPAQPTPQAPASAGPVSPLTPPGAPTTTSPAPAPAPPAPTPTPTPPFPVGPQGAAFPPGFAAPQPHPGMPAAAPGMYPFGPHHAGPHQPAPNQPGFRRPVQPISRPPAKPFGERLAAAFDRGLIGRILAILGVGVTLIGVVLLLVLAAQAGLLRAEFRVALGVTLAAALLTGGLWIGRSTDRRPAAIALVATGFGTAYLDVLAATVIYEWLPGIVGLVLAGVVAAGGLWLAGRWNSETLGLLVVVPLIVLGPIITTGFDLTLVCFMLVLSAGALWVQLGRDWIWLYSARVAAPTLTLLLTYAFGSTGSETTQLLLIIAATVGFALAIGTGALTLRWARNPLVTALVAVTSMLPLLLADIGLEPALVAAFTAACSIVLIVISFAGDRLVPGLTAAVRHTWLAAGAVGLAAAAVIVFEGHTLVMVFLAMSLVCTIGTRHARDNALGVLIAGTGFGVIGLLGFLAVVPMTDLFSGSGMSDRNEIAVLGAAALLLAAAVSLAIAVTAVGNDDLSRVTWIMVGLITLWAITDLCVTAGVLLAGTREGFLGGQVTATIVWMMIAAGLLWYARRTAGSIRTLALITALVLIAASIAKLFLFDLATLDGVFRVIVFMVTGLIILGLGSVYARTLGDAPTGQNHDERSATR